MSRLRELVARYDELKDTVIALCDPELTVDQRRAYISLRTQQLKADIRTELLKAKLAKATTDESAQKDRRTHLSGPGREGEDGL